MADFPADPVALNMRGAATFFSSTGINTTGVQVLAANPNRKMGIWLFTGESGGTDAVLFGDASGTALCKIQPQGATNSVPPVFIPGTGALFIKASANTVDVAGYEF